MWDRPPERPRTLPEGWEETVVCPPCLAPCQLVGSSVTGPVTSGSLHDCERGSSQVLLQHLPKRTVPSLASCPATTAQLC